MDLLLVRGTLLTKIWEESEKELEKMQSQTMSSGCNQERILSGKCLLFVSVILRLDKRTHLDLVKCIHNCGVAV